MIILISFSALFFHFGLMKPFPVLSMSHLADDDCGKVMSCEPMTGMDACLKHCLSLKDKAVMILGTMPRAPFLGVFLVAVGVLFSLIIYQKRFFPLILSPPGLVFVKNTILRE